MKLSLYYTLKIIFASLLFGVSALSLSAQNSESYTNRDDVDVKELKQMRAVIRDRPMSEPLVSVEQRPKFRGGDKEMIKFIIENLNYPIIDTKDGVQGHVTVRFIVDIDGFIKQPTIMRSLSRNCDKEALRVLGLMSEWTPGKQNGKDVPVYYTLPIVFRLPEQEEIIEILKMGFKEKKGL